MFASANLMIFPAKARRRVTWRSLAQARGASGRSPGLWAKSYFDAADGFGTVHKRSPHIGSWSYTGVTSMAAAFPIWTKWLQRDDAEPNEVSCMLLCVHKLMHKKKIGRAPEYTAVLD